MAATVSVLGIGVGAADADTVGNFVTAQQRPLTTFTGGASGILSVPDAGNGGVATSAFSPFVAGAKPAVSTFGPVHVTGPAVTTGSTTTETLSDGSSALNDGTSLLSGTFAASTLGGNLPTTSGSVMKFGSFSVIYTGGSYLTAAG